MKIKDLFLKTDEWDRKPDLSDESVATDKTWSSQKVQSEISSVDLGEYQTLKADVDKINEELTTNRTKLITSINNIIDII